MRDADTLLALVAGLGNGILLGHHSAKRALLILDSYLDRLNRLTDR